MESNFFSYLLTYLRRKQCSAYYSMPAKINYPVCELDHRETQVFFGKEIITFNVTVYFDCLSQQSITDYVRKVENLLEMTLHILEEGNYTGRIRVNNKKQPPHERGKLRQCTLECTALIRRR
jgi:hypothetical protein